MKFAYMKALWNSFDENSKPEWLTYDKILDYEKMIGIPAILVEMDYKGYYERFALTPEEFKNEFPKTFEHFSPIEESNSDTIRPLVHIWFEPCVVGDASWERHFTDMEEGLPESDIESGNLAYIDKNQMQSLSKYLEDVSVYHCRAVIQHNNLSFATNDLVSQFAISGEEQDYKVVNLKCAEEGPSDGAQDVTDVKVFTFEFDIKLPRDSQTDIINILNNVDGGELLSQHYERSAEGASLEDKILSAKKAINDVSSNDKLVTEKQVER